MWQNPYLVGPHYNRSWGSAHPSRRRQWLLPTEPNCSCNCSPSISSGCISFILSLVPHRADADEILQETNLVLWRKFEQFRPGSDFRAWAFQVAYNKVKAFRERRGRDRLRFGREVMDRLAAVAAATADDLPASQDALQECKEQLSQPDRDLIERRYEPGATVASVAAEVGRSVAAVYKAVVRIRRALFECIQRSLKRDEKGGQAPLAGTALRVLRTKGACPPFSSKREERK